MINNNQETIAKLPETPLVHQFEVSKKGYHIPKTVVIAVIIITGIISGYLISGLSRKAEIGSLSKGNIQPAKQVVGSTDTKTFRDSAEGTLQVGGINGEGTHRLVRPGGDSQTVYLTSSILDLSQFVDKKVRVWGETFSAKKAGWLMDVGKIEVL